MRKPNFPWLVVTAVAFYVLGYVVCKHDVSRTATEPQSESVTHETDCRWPEQPPAKVPMTKAPPEPIQVKP